VDELYDMLAEALPARTTAEWLAIFQRLDIPHSPVRSPQDLLSDPHLDDVGFFACNFAAATPVKRTLRQAVTVEDVATAPDLAPRPLGADTEAVLREAGCSEAEIAAVLPRDGSRAR
jgi:crotonobetainyl-CoA:carnitine CoA-transferase CaiB-like acyl-CoA transferase